MKALRPAALPAPFGNYSHGVAEGRLIVTSGQLGLAADGRIPDGVTASELTAGREVRPSRVTSSSSSVVTNRGVAAGSHTPTEPSPAPRITRPDGSKAAA